LEYLSLSDSSAGFQIRTILSFLKIILLIAAVILVSVFLVELFVVNKVLGIEPKAAYFSEEINISKNNGTSELPQVTAEGNNVYVVWQDDTNGNANGNYDVYFAHSTDNGRTFESVTNLSKNNGTSELPQVTAEGNNVYVVWQDDTNGNYDVYSKSSSTNGSKFKSTRNLSKNNGTSELPQIASTKDLFYVFWKDETNGIVSAYFKEGKKESSTANVDFGSTKKIVNSGNFSKLRLTLGDNIFTSVWNSNFDNSSVIKFYPLGFSDDSTDAIQLTRSLPYEMIPNVSIAGYNAGVYFVWENKKMSTSDIFFKKMSYVQND
jgi:hypothetical protein